MERRTTIGVAAGATLMVAAATVAIGLNVAIMSNRSPTSGPGTFERTAVVGRAAATTVPPVPANETTSTIAATAGYDERDSDGGADHDAPSAPVDRDHDSDHDHDHDHDHDDD